MAVGVGLRDLGGGQRALLALPRVCEPERPRVPCHGLEYCCHLGPGALHAQRERLQEGVSLQRRAHDWLRWHHSLGPERQGHAHEGLDRCTMGETGDYGLYRRDRHAGHGHWGRAAETPPGVCQFEVLALKHGSRDLLVVRSCPGQVLLGALCHFTGYSSQPDVQPDLLGLAPWSLLVCVHPGPLVEHGHEVRQCCRRVACLRVCVLVGAGGLWGDLFL
mmetsp:Transcript_90666/g.210908  ORF Transcript_90666/g.210908 Transcript_90666/m.210908 type:complete len:219 (-) Transcript_90666:321-977(-)